MTRKERKAKREESVRQHQIEWLEETKNWFRQGYNGVEVGRRLSASYRRAVKRNPQQKQLMDIAYHRLLNDIGEKR
jgi:hypothetical protein